MARLTVNSYDGDGFLAWFNGEGTSKRYFDVSDWVDSLASSYAQEGYTRDQVTQLWTLTKNSVRFAQKNVPNTSDNNGVISTTYADTFIEWKGRFQIKGDRITGGQVTSLSRDWGGSYGNIDITDFKYNLKSEMGAFWTLSLPNEITSPLTSGTIGAPEFDQYGHVTNYVYDHLRGLSAGSSYIFSTAYG